jgi:hypothetical protein
MDHVLVDGGEFIRQQNVETDENLGITFHVNLLLLLLTDKNLVFGAPACAWRFAGDGELVLARIHLAHILPAEDEPGKRQFLPVFWRLWPSARSLACGGGSGGRWFRSGAERNWVKP